MEGGGNPPGATIFLLASVSIRANTKPHENPRFRPVVFRLVFHEFDNNKGIKSQETVSPKMAD